MKYIIRMQTRLTTFSLLLAVGFLAGCASQLSAPIRDGNGVQQPPGAAAPGQSATLHTVRQGDTLLGIARQYGVTLPDLVSWNMLTDPNQIHVGQALRVAPPGAESGAVATAIPVVPGGGELPAPAVNGASVPLKQGPIGGRQPYSDEAWAKLSPGTTVTPPTPVAPPEEAARPAGDSLWQWPSGGRVIAGYSEASNKGLDIGGNVGDPVYASAAGKVVYAGSGLRGYGKLVVIKHNQEYNSVYAHNDKLLVKEDDQVTQGQKIAELGSSESDRPKLHFEIRKQGKAVDPMKYLPAR